MKLLSFQCCTHFCSGRVIMRRFQEKWIRQCHNDHFSCYIQKKVWERISKDKKPLRYKVSPKKATKRFFSVKKHGIFWLFLFSKTKGLHNTFCAKWLHLLQRKTASAITLQKLRLIDAQYALYILKTNSLCVTK